MPDTNRRTFLKTVGVAGAATMVGGAGVVGADEHGSDDGAGAAVRVVHASPDAPNVDVYVDGSKVLSDVPFRAVSDYLSLKAGTYTVKITAAGDPETVAFEGDVTVEDADYTVAAVGELSEDTFAPLVLEDAPSAPAEGKAQVRLVHASPDAPAVDVTVKGADLTLFDDVEFGEHSDYVEVPAGDYTLEVRGATEKDDGDVVATFDVTVEAGMSYTAFATGYLTPDDEPEDRAFDLLVAADGSGMDEKAGEDEKEKEAAVRAVHAIPDAPNVDVYVDDSKVLSDVPFRAVSDYLALPVGEYTVTVTAAGEPHTVVFEETLTVEKGAYTVAAVGELSEKTQMPLVLADDATKPADDTAKVRLVHASPDAPAVDVTVKGADLTLFDDVEFGERSDYVEVPAGDYTLEVRGATDCDDGDVVATFDVTVEGGMAYTAFATGYLTPDDEPSSCPFDLVVASDATTKGETDDSSNGKDGEDGDY
ncbi:Tat (twin-arginine translocation) pathway signal sequence [Halogranum amylolyticum]|uniref:Tat (Twin-arginine translocation) pathway signal sequence n=1 Tax=Halogranum amylolyticum TaxID=660520 RepID=A0A1H8U4E0_9EURY|nr:DUF4397 domain-containing protein [Halogranum amylolyticum]SEO97518.1 Tat (twin-arginine translocation) pathway signal sequence [Halogranum amylolyticum]